MFSLHITESYYCAVCESPLDVERTEDTSEDGGIATKVFLKPCQQCPREEALDE